MDRFYNLTGVKQVVRAVSAQLCVQILVRASAEAKTCPARVSCLGSARFPERSYVGPFSGENISCTGHPKLQVSPL